MRRFAVVISSPTVEILGLFLLHSLSVRVRLVLEFIRLLSCARGRLLCQLQLVPLRLPQVHRLVKTLELALIGNFGTFLLLTDRTELLLWASCGWLRNYIAVALAHVE